MKMILSLITIAMPICMSICSHIPDKVWISIENKSNDTIYSFVSVLYPDTMIPSEEKDVFQDIKKYHLTMPYRQKDLIFGFNEYRYIYEYYKTDTLCCFVIDYNVIKEISYEDIRKNNRILARYDLSLQDVEAFDGYFEYPPSQRMIDSGMKIYINPNNPDL